MIPVTLLTIEEAASRLRVSTRTLRRMLSEGKLRKIFVGARGPRISEDEIRLFLGHDVKSRSAKTLLEAFIDHALGGEPGDILAVSVVDVFCHRPEDAEKLSRCLTMSIVGEHRAKDPGEPPPPPGASSARPEAQARFEFSYLQSEVKARFVLYGPLNWQARALSQLRSWASEFRERAASRFPLRLRDELGGLADSQEATNAEAPTGERADDQADPWPRR